jgi:hypothetical protein
MKNDNIGAVLCTITMRSYKAFSNKNLGADRDFWLLYILYEQLRDEEKN